MSKLQILIPQYNEDNNTIKPLLDSIAIQQGIDLKEDIEVFIGNDGSETKLSVDFLKQYPFRMQYHQFEHSGLAATRQKLQDLTTADYIMFCDADDQFISTIALQLIIDQMKKPFDVLVCDFLEEHTTPHLLHILHHDDSIFVHGKVYRRQFLLDNQIKWNPTLREHQDSAFNVLARSIAKTQRICAIPLYMWCDNPKSISRRDGIYHSPKTWCAMLDSYCRLIDDLNKRGMGNYAIYYAKWALYATYYEMSHNVWNSEKVTQLKFTTYAKIAWFYRKYELLIKNFPQEKEEEISNRTKEIALKRGKLNDMPPLDEWLQNILKL